MKNNKGITLIALVITIIVLLILAGISIAMLMGDNSILKNATTAAKETSISGKEEEIKLIYEGILIENLGNNDAIDAENMNRALSEHSINAVASGENPIRIEYSTGEVFEMTTSPQLSINKVDNQEEIATPAEVFEYEDNGHNAWAITGIKDEYLTDDPSSLGRFNNMKIASTSNILIAARPMSGNAMFLNNEFENKIIVPKRIGDKDVIEIADEAFADIYNLNEIVLPNTIVIIGDQAFRGTGIKTITLPRITIMGSNVFEDTEITDIYLNQEEPTTEWKSDWNSGMFSENVEYHWKK